MRPIFSGMEALETKQGSSFLTYEYNNTDVYFNFSEGHYAAQHLTVTFFRNVREHRNAALWIRHC